MRPSILLLVHLPPPYIGPAAINQAVLDSDFLRARFYLVPVPINTSTVLNEIGSTSVKKWFIFIQAFFRILWSLLRKRFDAAYISLTPTGIGFYKDCFLVLLVKLFRLKRIYHLHGKGIGRYQDRAHQYLYAWCFKGSKTIIISERFYEEIRAYIPKKDVFVLPNASSITRDHAYAQNLVRQRQAHTKITLLFLSNMVRSKGVFVALEAAERLKQRGYSFVFCFAGAWFDITPEEFSRAVAEKGLTREVVHKGFLPASDKEKLFEEADIFVFPTYNDIFGIVNVEAMHYALPVVSTFEGAIPEIVTDGVTGFLVPPHDARALAEKIETLMKDSSLRERMGLAGRQKMEREYTFEKFERRLTEILQSSTV